MQYFCIARSVSAFEACATTLLVTSKTIEQQQFVDLSEASIPLLAGR
jgi:hypothetical protein